MIRTNSWAPHLNSFLHIYILKPRLWQYWDKPFEKMFRSTMFVHSWHTFCIPSKCIQIQLKYICNTPLYTFINTYMNLSEFQTDVYHLYIICIHLHWCSLYVVTCNRHTWIQLQHAYVDTTAIGLRGADFAWLDTTGLRVILGLNNNTHSRIQQQLAYYRHSYGSFPWVHI